MAADPTMPMPMPLQMELLGELQLSFVVFVSLSSLQGFRHWQALSALLCRCGDALKTDPALFTAFIRVREWPALLCPPPSVFFLLLTRSRLRLWFVGGSGSGDVRACGVHFRAALVLPRCRVLKPVFVSGITD